MANYACVHVLHRRLVKASGCTASVLAMPQIVPVSLFCVYSEPSVGNFDDIVSFFEARLPSLLDHFVVNPRCGNQGADLVVGEVDVTLASLDYGQLEASLARIGLPIPYDADVALSVQLVSFARGGFAVAWRCNKVLDDVHGLCMVASVRDGLVHR